MVNDSFILRGFNLDREFGDVIKFCTLPVRSTHKMHCCLCATVHSNQSVAALAPSFLWSRGSVVLLRNQPTAMEHPAHPITRDHVTWWSKIRPCRPCQDGSRSQQWELMLKLVVREAAGAVSMSSSYWVVRRFVNKVVENYS